MAGLMTRTTGLDGLMLLQQRADEVVEWDENIRSWPLADIPFLHRDQTWPMQRGMSASHPKRTLRQFALSADQSEPIQ